MSIKTILLLCCFLGGIKENQAQNTSKKQAITIEEIYQICKKAHKDSTTQLQNNLLYIHKKDYLDSNKIYHFYKEFKKKCLEDNEKEMYRRTILLEKITQMRLQNTPIKVVEKVFNAFYDDFIDAKDYSSAVECLFEFGYFYAGRGDVLQAIKMYFYTEKFAEKHQLKRSLHGVYFKLGYALWEVNLPNLSNKYLHNALKMKQTIKSDSMVIFNALGMNYQKLDSLDKSLSCFEAGIKVSQNSDNPLFVSIIRGNAAVTLHKQNDQNKAFAYAQEDKNMCFEQNLWENAVGALHWLVRIELKRKNFDHAKILLDSLDNVIPKTKDKLFLSLKRQKEARFMYYESIKDFQNAIKTQKEVVYYENLTQEYVNKNKISELEILATSRLYEQGMQEKEQEKQFVNILFTVISVIFLVIILVFFWFFYKKITKIKTINNQLTDEITQLKIQLFDQIDQIREENQAFVENEIENKKIFEENFEEISNENPNENTDILNNEINNQTTENLQQLRAFNLTQKDQWKAFKTSFLKVYPTFETHIIKKIGEVSAAELRLMMLHKLGLNSKEIALMLLISPTSVKQGKYRLYKKINISSAEELDEFLDNP